VWAAMPLKTGGLEQRALLYGDVTYPMKGEDNLFTSDEILQGRERNGSCYVKSFHSFRLDTANHCLWRGQERVPIAPKAYDVLRYLVENPGRLVTQDDLLQALWPETYVNPEVLRKYILDIRKILGDRPEKPAFIETVTKRGYRFIAPVIDESTMPQSEPATARDVDPETIGSEVEEPSRSHYHLRPLVIIPILAVIAGAALLGHFWLARSRATHAPANANSIAVLPFADLSPGKDQEYFSDGLTDELITDLTKYLA
jgi:DNA-binding winged helix-turn-helix (wHTH) protein